MNALDEYHLVPVPRTLKLPGSIWKATRAKGRRDDKPVREVLEEAVNSELAKLVKQLRACGVRGELTNDKVVRVPVSDALLKRLRNAKGKTGLPTIQMLALSLQRHTARKRKRR